MCQENGLTGRHNALRDTWACVLATMSGLGKIGKIDKYNTKKGHSVFGTQGGKTRTGCLFFNSHKNAWNGPIQCLILRDIFTLKKPKTRCSDFKQGQNSHTAVVLGCCTEPIFWVLFVGAKLVFKTRGEKNSRRSLQNCVFCWEKRKFAGYFLLRSNTENSSF